MFALLVGAVPSAACIGSVRTAAECLLSEGSEVSFACWAAFRGREDARAIGAFVMSPLLLVMFAMSLFLGVPVTAGVLGRGTVRLSWWLTPSRFRWYLARVLPI